jgi:hypothetical protein
MANMKVVNKVFLCPSSSGFDGNQGKIFGVINGTVQKPQVSYRKDPQPITKDLLESLGSITPTEIFRIAALCEESSCQHFNGKNCSLVTRVVERLPVVVEDIPRCSIRQECQWWEQQGTAACLRCPQVVTDDYNPSALTVEVSIPTSHL